MRPVRPLVIAALISSAAGCGASGLTGDTFHGRGVAFRIAKIPERWRRLDVSHAALAFRDEASGGTVAVNGRCGMDGEDVPLASLTQHLFIRFTEREIQQQKVVPFDGREAMHTVLVAKLDGVPMKFDVWVLKKDGCVYDLDFMAPPSRFDQGAAEFERFVRGFSTLPSHGD